jgi:hypothetical protein
MLREYAEQIGLDPSFTIQGREDSADLMNLVKTLPASAACPRRVTPKLAAVSKHWSQPLPVERDGLRFGFDPRFMAGSTRELSSLFNERETDERLSEL